MKRTCLIFAALMAQAAFGQGHFPATNKSAGTISQVQHVIVVVQENRTPDNLLGSCSTLISNGFDISANGKNSSGTSFPLTSGTLAFTNCDMGHAPSDWAADYNSGGMNGQDLAHCGACSGQCTGPGNLCGSCSAGWGPYTFVQNSDVSTYCSLFTTYASGDRMFQSNRGPSMPSHMYLFAGTSQITAAGAAFTASPSVDLVFFNDNAAGGSPSKASGCNNPLDTFPTAHSVGGGNAGNQVSCTDNTVTPILSDLLDAASISWKYYTPSLTGANSPDPIWIGPTAFTRVCGTVVSGNCTGAEYTAHVVNNDSVTVLTDIAGGTLPQVAWVIPSNQNSDHAHSNTGGGPAWVNSIISAVCGTVVSGHCTGQYWPSTVIIVMWDDWGGFSDHVSPQVAAGVPNGNYPTPGPGTFNALLGGFRVPLLVAGKFAKPGYVSHYTHDFGSIHRYIETVFQNNGAGLYPGALGMLDANQNTVDAFADMLDYTQTADNLPPPAPFDQEGKPMDAQWFINDWPGSYVGQPDDDDLPGDVDAQAKAGIVRVAKEISDVPKVLHLTLMEDLSSKLPSGSTFTVKEQQYGLTFTGRVITHPARHFMRRGSLQLLLSPAMEIISIGANKIMDEEEVRARRTRQLIGLASAAAITEAFDDWVIDPAFTASGKDHKAAYWYGADAAVFVGVMAAQKGGDVRIKKGTIIEAMPIVKNRQELDSVKD